MIPNSFKSPSPFTTPNTDITDSVKILTTQLMSKIHSEIYCNCKQSCGNFSSRHITTQLKTSGQGTCFQLRVVRMTAIPNMIQHISDYSYTFHQETN